MIIPDGMTPDDDGEPLTDAEFYAMALIELGETEADCMARISAIALDIELEDAARLRALEQAEREAESG